MNAKMKVLSLALVGLCGFAGSALAACPGGPAVADGGAWTSKAQLSGGTVAIATPGLDSSECKLNAQLGNSFASLATVLDDTPANEPRYRFQFLVNADATGNFGLTDAVSAFSANAAAAAHGRVPILQLALVPGAGGAKRISFVASCAGGASFRCSGQTADLPAGVNRIEVDLTIGASGSLKYWLNAPAGTTEPAATGTVAITGGNADWTGVDKGVLGLGAPSPSFKNTHNGQLIGFDTFDSRRSTYIGS